MNQNDIRSPFIKNETSGTSTITPLNSGVQISWKNLSVFIAEPIKKSTKTQVQIQHQLNNKQSSLYENQQAMSLDQSNLGFKHRCVLDNQSGIAKSGELTALMGPSGAGKTTFLSCLSQRITVNKIQKLIGQVQANGVNYNSRTYNDFGVFLMQNDILMGTMTVRGILFLQEIKKKETLLFSANMRLKETQKDKILAVDRIIKDLQLNNCQNTIVGNEQLKGISGGERKRTSIGVELIANPAVLILDGIQLILIYYFIHQEPTSGLDSFTAFILIDLLQKIARRQELTNLQNIIIIRENSTIIFTIHQPSADIFSKFDQFILLYEGRTAYQGPANQILTYMKSHGLDLPIFTNPCDFLMKQLNSENNIINFDNFIDSKVNQEYHDEMNSKLQEKRGIEKRIVQNSYCYEFKILSQRAFINNLRYPQLFKGRIFLTLFLTLFQSVLFHNLSKKREPSQTEPNSPNLPSSYTAGIAGSLFQLGTGFLIGSLGNLVNIFPIERQIFLKEQNSKQYRVSTYYISKLMIEVPFGLLLVIFQTTLVYYFMGFIQETECFIKFCTNNLYHYLLVLICILVSINGNGLGLLTGALIPDPKLAAAMVNIMVVPFQVFSGQFGNLDSLRSWISWFQYLSPAKYFFEGLCRTQLEGISYPIEGLLPYNPIEQLSLNFGLDNCIKLLGITALGFHILSFIILKIQVYKLNV